MSLFSSLVTAAVCSTCVARISALLRVYQRGWQPHRPAAYAQSRCSGQICRTSRNGRPGCCAPGSRLGTAASSAVRQGSPCPRAGAGRWHTASARNLSHQALTHQCQAGGAQEPTCDRERMRSTLAMNSGPTSLLHSARPEGRQAAKIPVHSPQPCTRWQHGDGQGSRARLRHSSSRLPRSLQRHTTSQILVL